MGESEDSQHTGSTIPGLLLLNPTTTSTTDQPVTKVSEESGPGNTEVEVRNGEHNNVDIEKSSKPELLDFIDQALADPDNVEFSSDDDEDTQMSDVTKPDGRVSVETNSSPERDPGSESDTGRNSRRLDNEPGEGDSDSDDGSASSSSSSSESGEASDDEDNVMYEEGGLDDDNEGDSGDRSAPLRTKNEITDDAPPQLPEAFEITENTPIEYVGELIQVVERTAIIKAAVSGEFRILEDSSSVLCFEDKTILGVLYETFGQVQSPLYSVKLQSIEEAQTVIPRKGQKVYYVVPASSFVFTEQVRTIKGSDASNLHDEEIPEEEQEFSDDEKEMASKAVKKNRKKKTNNNKKRKPFTNPEPLRAPQPRPDYDNPNYNSNSLRTNTQNNNSTPHPYPIPALPNQYQYQYQQQQQQQYLQQMQMLPMHVQMQMAMSMNYGQQQHTTPAQFRNSRPTPKPYDPNSNTDELYYGEKNDEYQPR